MMTEVEITDIPPLRPNEQSLLEMHSLLNMLNVLRGELGIVGLVLAEDDHLLSRGLDRCDQLIADLRSPQRGLAAARQTDAYESDILAEVRAAAASHAGAAANPEILESIANLESVFAILRVRAREILARAAHPERWEEFSATTLQEAFVAVFTAIEKNSRNRFRIIYNPALQRPHDYYIDLRLDSEHGDRLWMPSVLQDVMRDLTANARKYTAPGGRITAALYETATDLQFVVEDTGRGIPPDELTAVVEFGRRARNVADVRTLGGGFGLTKAFFVTKQFHGRFWIASELGRGTRVRLMIPRSA